MKNLKFRVWDKQDEKWRLPFGEIWDFQEMISSDRFEVTQFIGATDVKGQKIFEGDIVEIKYENETYYEFIHYSENQFRFRMTNFSEGNDKIDEHSVTVVGNVFDNEFFKDKIE